MEFRIPPSTFCIVRKWFNDRRESFQDQADATYRGDPREISELNFARFDAKLEQRVTQLDAKLEQGLAEVRADLAGLAARLEQRLAEVRAQAASFRWVRRDFDYAVRRA